MYELIPNSSPVACSETGSRDQLEERPAICRIKTQTLFQPRQQHDEQKLIFAEEERLAAACSRFEDIVF